MTGRLLSLAHLSLLDLAPTVLLAVAAEAGFGAVGLRISPAHRHDEPFPLVGDAALVRQTRRGMQATGVTVLDVEVVRLDGAIAWPALAPVIDTAAELGARYLVVNASDPDPARLSDEFGRLCDAGAASGLRPVLEFVPYSSVRTLSSAAGIVAPTSGGVLVDALHLSRSGGSPRDLTGIDREYLPYVQLCDAPGQPPGGGLGELMQEARHNRLPPGHGQLALREMLSFLPRDDMPVSVEAPSDGLRAQHGDIGFARLLHRSASALLASAGTSPRPAPGS